MSNRAPVPPPDSEPLTLTLHGLAPLTFRPIGPTIVGTKYTIRIEYEPTTQKCAMVCDPPNSLTPCQQLQLILGLLGNVVQVAGINEAAAYGNLSSGPVT